MMAAIDGNERVIATAQHIVRTLGANQSMTEDMLLILSKFDGRFSNMNQRLRRNSEANDSGSAPMELRNVKETLEIAAECVLKWDMATSKGARKSMIWDCGRNDAVSYLDSVDALQDLMGSLSDSRRERVAFDRAQNLLQLAMGRLQDEFRHLLVTHSVSADLEWILESVLGASSPATTREAAAQVAAGSSAEEEDGEDIPVPEPATGQNLTIELLPAGAISDLNDIARRMIAGGYGRECCQIYAGVRKAVLEQSLHRLGVERLTIEDVHKMAWENLELRIKMWIQAMNVAVRTLYASERILSDAVFSGMGPWRETSFCESARGSMLQLLSFGEAIAVSRRSPEKLFKILDMYEAVWELIPDINSIFSFDPCSSVRSEANGILVRLGEAARGTFVEFENAIRRDASKTPVPGGAVHPLTRFVMNYIWLLFYYSRTLKRLLGDKKGTVPMLMGAESNRSLMFSTEDKSISEADHLSPLAVQIVWLTVLLECNLDGKSKLYKDVAQAHLFLMNNVNYIVQKVKRSELVSLLGEDWVKKHSGQVRQYAVNYVRTSWKKVLACLSEEGLSLSGSFSSDVSKVAVKDRFKNFNAAFEELHRTQSTWVVPDPQVRDELRMSIAEKLIPAYRSFSSKYQGYLKSERHPERYSKHTPEGLEKYLNDLFEGSSSSVATRRRSFSNS